MRNAAADIIILTWNQKQILADCVESFITHTKVPCRLIIIDNASSDGTREYLATLKRTDTIELKILLNSENLGFVEGMNQGIAISDAPYVCLANNDLTFTKGWLEEIISVFESNKAIGVLNPSSNNLGVRSSIDLEIDAFSSELQKEFKGVFVEMPFCIGFCMVIRREVIEKVGGFSKEFSPFFYEDTDYSLKVSQAGYLIGVAKGAYVLHKEHVSVNKLGSKKEAYFLKSREVFQKKWGRILRMLFVVADDAAIDSILLQAIDLARSGNYVWIAVKRLRETSSEIFRQRKLTEHSGVSFFSYSNILHLSWKVIIKKKRYDAVITKSAFLRSIFSFLGYNVLDIYDGEKITALKFAVLK
jgi:GT2 family glycosyltransferase